MVLPDYDDLPLASGGGRSAWGLFGPNDDLGMLNLVTPDVTRAAARLVRTGEVFPLDLPLDFFDPPLFGRTPLRVEKRVSADGQGIDEVYQDFNPQSSSQWDALAHVAYAEDTFYNGATLDDVVHRGRNTIEHWARHGIATRGVLLDVAATLAAQGRTFDPGSAHTFSVADLEAARKAADVEFQPGDVIVIRTGFVEWYAGLDQAERTRISTRAALTACGVEHTEEMARYLWNSHAAALASDAASLEVWPMDRSPEAHPFGMLHRLLLAQFGMAIGELWSVERLAERCAALGRHEFFLTSAPLQTTAGVGSTANVLAIL